MAHFLEELWGERSLTKVAGLFTRQGQAEATMEQLRNEAGLEKNQVRLLHPRDSTATQRELFGQFLRPQAIGASAHFIQTHLLGGLTGAVFGWALSMWVSRVNNPLFASSPATGLLVIVGFGITFGLLAAGWVCLRPDRIARISMLRAALEQNRWVLVAHPGNSEQTAKVKRVLRASAFEVHSAG